jgi:hypothetical protein
MSSEHSVPEYDVYSTHSTPQRSSASAQLDTEYVPRRFTHPARRAAQAPSPMRRASLPGRSSPVAKRTSPQSIRKKLRSPHTGSCKRKQRSPHQILSTAFVTDPVSPRLPDKVSRSSTPPQHKAPSKDPDEHDEALKPTSGKRRASHIQLHIQRESSHCYRQRCVHECYRGLSAQ